MRKFVIIRQENSRDPHHYGQVGAIAVERNVSRYISTDVRVPSNDGTGRIINQNINFLDMIEVEEVKWQDINKGDFIVTDKPFLNNLGGSFKPGYIAKVHRKCVGKSAINDQCDLAIEDEDMGGFGIWSYQSHAVESEATIYRIIGDTSGLKDFQEIVDTPREGVYDAQPQQEEATEEVIELVVLDEVKPRKKVIYEVVAKGESVLMTKSRKIARRLKAKLGGKESGVVVLKYDLDKEIR